MKNILKRITAIVIATLMLVSVAPVAFAGIEYSIDDAYAQCAELYPEFVTNIKAQGASDRMIKAFLRDVQEVLLGLDVTISEDNFEAYIMPAVVEVIGYTDHGNVRNALAAAYPYAVADGLEGKINEEFLPLVETIKSILFGDGESGDDVDEPTDESSSDEPSTDEPTSVEPSTDEPVTDEPATNEPSSEEPTTEEPSTNEPSSEEPTKDEPSTDKPTNKPVTGGPSGGTDYSEPDEGDEPSSEEKDEATEQPSQKPVTKPEDDKKAFTDMAQAAWAEEAVMALVDMGIISGYPDGTFLPNKSITRAEFAKIIVLASGRYDKKATVEFSDVKTTDWFYSYVASAYELGFIKGRSETVFDPNAKITRADLCTIVYRYIKSINGEFKPMATATFADTDKIPSYALEAVNALYSAGIVSGMGDNKFEPLAAATRAQSAKIIYGAIKAALGI